MSDPVKEQLSAYLDGELDEAELDLLSRRVAGDAELRNALGRYALCREALKADGFAAAPGVSTRALTGSSFLRSSGGAFAANVMAALESERMEHVPGQALRLRSFGSPALARRLRPAAGFAVAASVATLAVLSVQRAGMTPALVAGNEGAGVDGPAAAQTLAAADSEPSYTVPSTTSSRAFIPATRLTNYVVAHAEYSSPLGRRSMLSGVLAEGDAYDIDGDPAAPADAQPSAGDADDDVDMQVTQP